MYALLLLIYFVCCLFVVKSRESACGVKSPCLQEMDDFKGWGGECDVGVESESLIFFGCK